MINTTAVRKFMVKNGYKNLKELSLAMNIHHTTLWRILERQKDPDYPTLTKIIEFTGLTPNQLISTRAPKS